MAGQEYRSEPHPERDAFFDRVLHQHATLLYRIAYSVLRNPADAEDAVADTVLKLLRTGAWQHVAQERAFLSRAVWRCALDRFHLRPVGAEGEADLLAVADHEPSPEMRAAALEEHALLHGLIDRLPAELREPLVLSAVRELNSREIAAVLDLPEGTVRTRLMRARQQLRVHFEDRTNRTRGREVAARGMHG